MRLLLVLVLFLPISVQASLAQVVVYPTHAKLTWATEATVIPGTGIITVDTGSSIVSKESVRVTLEGTSMATLQSHHDDVSSSGSGVAIRYHAERAGTLNVRVQHLTSDIKWQSNYVAHLTTSLEDRPGGEIALQHSGRIYKPDNFSLQGAEVILSSAPLSPIIGYATGKPADNPIPIATHRLPVDVEAWGAPSIDQQVFFVATGVLGAGIPILPGTAELYRDGQPVGSASIPRLKRDARFAVMFGVDKGIRIEIVKANGIGLDPDQRHVRLTNTHVGAAPVRLFTDSINLATPSRSLAHYANAFVLNPGASIVPLQQQDSQ